MKKLSILCMLLLSINAFAQNISGKAYYQSKTTVDMDNFGGNQMSEAQKKMIMDRMKSMLEKTYILTFKGDESVYKEEEKLETGGSGRFGGMMGSFSAGEQYKNLKTNQLLEEREFFGKQFLINDTLANLQWEVGKESKQIGQYLAIKATAVKKIDENDFNFARRRGRGRNNDKTAEERKADSLKAIEDPLSQIEVPKELVVTAWFTPQIPVANGPAEYAGLPGLILELNIDRTTILCSKIVLNPNDMDEIEAPKKGDNVSREEYNKITKEKIEELQENFRGRGNGRGRN